MKKDLIQIAIDGTAASGKSTVSLLVSQKLSIPYLSSGKIFRSYAFALKDIDVNDEKAVKKEMKQFEFTFENGNFCINGINVSTDIANDNLSMKASTVSKYAYVRKRYQKDIKRICKKQSIIIDGRDIGTVILPKTPYKFYIDALPRIRAERRAKETGVSIKSKEFDKVLKEIKDRDYQDIHRKQSPLRKAKGAIVIDTSDWTAQRVADEIVFNVRKIKEELEKK